MEVAAPPTTDLVSADTLRSHKVDDAEDEAEMLQPATPTLAVVDDAAADATSVCVAFSGVHVSDERWQLDENADESASGHSNEGTRVAPFGFAANGRRDDVFNASTSPPSTHSPLEKTSNDGDADVDNLVSLPSPLANPAPAPAFDVFAPSPTEVQLVDTPGVERVPSLTTSAETVESEDVNDAEPLADDLSGLHLKVDDEVETPVDDQSTPPENVWDSVAEAPVSPENSLDELHDTPSEPAAREQNSGVTTSEVASSEPPAQSPAPQPHVNDEDDAAWDSTVATDASSLSPPGPPSHASLAIEFAPVDADSSAEKPTEQVDASEVVDDEFQVREPSQASSPQQQADAALPTAVPDIASFNELLQVSEASPPEPNKGTEPAANGGKAAAVSKQKNGRVVNRLTSVSNRERASDSAKAKAVEPAKAKSSSESMKVRASPPTKTSVLKTKATGDGRETASGATVAKAAPLKLKVQRTGLAPGSHTQDRMVKAATKSPVAPVPPKKPATSATASGKPTLELATPPPAPSSAVEVDGSKSIKKRLSSSELEAASNRLYSDAVESKKRKEILKSELEETFTFAPQVNAKRRPSIPDEKNRFIQLHEKAKQAAKRKEELRQKREKAECTFKPKITAKARKLSTASKSAKPRFENLYQQAQEIKQKREVKKSESEQKAVDACSFKPKIKTLKSPTKSRPLYDAERLKQRKLALEQKKIATELSECTFKPKVVTKAAKAKGDEASGKPGGDAALFDRLYQASQKRAENLEKLRHERKAQEKLVATFHPKITAAATTKAETKQPFYERLYSKDHMQKVTAEREQKKLEEEQKFSFKVSAEREQEHTVS